jgi:hypothetical protein
MVRDASGLGDDMANPTAPTEGSGLTVDLISDTAGAARLKLSVGSNTIAGATNVGGYQGVATHQVGSTFTNGHPTVLAGVDDGTGHVAAMTKPRTPTKFVTLSAVDISSEATVWAPASGKKFRLLGYVITQGTLTGNVTLKDNTAGTTILVIPAHTVGIAQVSPPLGDGILSAAANNVLTATGVNTETISGYIFGVEE